jgi:hypothetical protein
MSLSLSPIEGGAIKRLVLATTALAMIAPSTAAAARLRIPTGAGGTQYRPYVLTVSADGSEYFGGATGHRFAARRRSLRDLGRLHWTQYGARSARATGVIWGLYGPGPFSADRKFEREGKVRLHAYRPLRGVFTRLAYSGRVMFKTADGRTLRSKFRGTAKAQRYGRRWFW